MVGHRPQSWKPAEVATCFIPEGPQAKGPRPETGARLRLPTCEGGWRSCNQRPWSRGLCGAASLPEKPACRACQGTQPGPWGSVSRLEDLGWGERRAGQVEPRRKPVDEEGKTERGERNKNSHPGWTYKWQFWHTQGTWTPRELTKPLTGRWTLTGWKANNRAISKWPTRWDPQGENMKNTHKKDNKLWNKNRQVQIKTDACHKEWIINAGNKRHSHWNQKVNRLGIHSRMDTVKRELVGWKIAGGIQSEHNQSNGN